MSEINQQIKTVQESMPNLSTAIAAPTGSILDKAETASTKGLPAGEYQIPLEPGEVPPIPLGPEAWNPSGGEAPSMPESAMQQEITPPLQQFEPIKEPQPDLAAFEEKPAISKAPAATAAMSKGSQPDFEKASEYDFEFDEGKPLEKQVVIPEKDSMSETLKALGWEEEDGQDK